MIGKLSTRHLLLLLSILGAYTAHASEKPKAPKAFELRGKVVDIISGLPIEDASILVTNIRNDFSKEITTDESGYFSTKIIAESVFSVIGFKQRHFHSEIFTLSTIGRENDEKVEINIALLPMALGNSYPLKISFAPNEINFSDESKLELDRIFRVMAKNRDVVMEIGCHTDSRGDDAYNLELSQQRAQASVNYLINKGISKLRLQARGYGETQPINSCTNGVRCSSSEHSINRRTEIKVIAFIE
ncbi:OmpA family protein [Flammeovirgaceae bacterium SG7u.111]|nr:OmpA family protein [Flammeovirgaceae bacterium SG7u.132]WPO38081.1 OmpA family protein [Flammeovirgaceae bacterium SG7u.111]